MTTYALGVKRPFQKDYIILMETIDKIDELFLTMGRAGVLEKIKQYDSTITEINPDCLAIFKLNKNNKWQEVENFIIEDEKILTFSLTKLLELKEAQKILNVLYSRFRHDLTKTHTSFLFKQTITSMKENKDKFLNNFYACDYEEQRKIRLFMVRDSYIKKFLQEDTLNKTPLKQNAKEPENSVEVLNIDEYILKKKKAS